METIKIRNHSGIKEILCLRTFEHFGELWAIHYPYTWLIPECPEVAYYSITHVNTGLCCPNEFYGDYPTTEVGLDVAQKQAKEYLDEVGPEKVMAGIERNQKITEASSEI